MGKFASVMFRLLLHTYCTEHAGGGGGGGGSGGGAVPSSAACYEAKLVVSLSCALLQSLGKCSYLDNCLLCSCAHDNAIFSSVLGEWLIFTLSNIAPKFSFCSILFWFFNTAPALLICILILPKKKIRQEEFWQSCGGRAEHLRGLC